MYTLMMLKPDATSAPYIIEEVAHSIGQSRLAIEHQVDMRLAVTDVQQLFPAFDPAECPITVTLLTRYLTSGDVRFIVLRGPDCIDLALSMRRRIRQRFAVGCFCNCLHAAADPGEAVMQLSWLSDRLSRPFPWLHGQNCYWAPPKLLGVFGKLTTVDRSAVEAEAAEVWREAAQAGWDHLWQSSWMEGSATTLISDSAHSIDYVVSALVDLGIMPLATAIRAVLQVDRIGRDVIYAGSNAAAAMLADRLRVLGLDACFERDMFAMAPGIEIGVGQPQ
jgi:nucleoside diphosphate kinase